MKWFAAGNKVEAVIAVGNVATGFIAFGNVARGVVAVGNLAVGVVAVGNVGFGVIGGAGATIGIGLFALAGVQAFPAWLGFGVVGTSTDVTVLAGLLPVLVWLVAGAVTRVNRPTAEHSGLVPLGGLADGFLARGRVLPDRITSTPLRANPHRPDTVLALRVRQGDRVELVEATEDVRRAALSGGEHADVILTIEASELAAQREDAYRDRPDVSRVLRAASAEVLPHPELPVSERVKGVLRVAWFGGALVGMFGVLARVVLS